MSRSITPNPGHSQRSRATTPNGTLILPSLQHSTQQQQTKQKQQITLETFDENASAPPRFSTPRSIETCKMLGVEPSELLKRNVKYFMTRTQAASASPLQSKSGPTQMLPSLLNTVSPRSPVSPSSPTASQQQSDPKATLLLVAQKQAAAYETQRLATLAQCRAQRRKLIDKQQMLASFKPAVGSAVGGARSDLISGSGLNTRSKQTATASGSHSPMSLQIPISNAAALEASEQAQIDRLAELKKRHLKSMLKNSVLQSELYAEKIAAEKAAEQAELQRSKQTQLEAKKRAQRLLQDEIDRKARLDEDQRKRDAKAQQLDQIQQQKEAQRLTQLEQRKAALESERASQKTTALEHQETQQQLLQFKKQVEKLAALQSAQQQKQTAAALLASASTTSLQRSKRTSISGTTTHSTPGSTPRQGNNAASSSGSGQMSDPTARQKRLEAKNVAAQALATTQTQLAALDKQLSDKHSRGTMSSVHAHELQQCKLRLQQLAKEAALHARQQQQAAAARETEAEQARARAAARDDATKRVREQQQLLEQQRLDALKAKEAAEVEAEQKKAKERARLEREARKAKALQDAQRDSVKQREEQLVEERREAALAKQRAIDEKTVALAQAQRQALEEKRVSALIAEQQRQSQVERLARQNAYKTEALIDKLKSQEQKQAELAAEHAALKQKRLEVHRTQAAELKTLQQTMQSIQHSKKDQAVTLVPSLVANNLNNKVNNNKQNAKQQQQQKDFAPNGTLSQLLNEVQLEKGQAQERMKIRRASTHAPAPVLTRVATLHTNHDEDADDNLFHSQRIAQQAARLAAQQQRRASQAIKPATLAAAAAASSSASPAPLNKMRSSARQQSMESAASIKATSSLAPPHASSGPSGGGAALSAPSPVVSSSMGSGLSARERLYNAMRQQQ